MKITIDKQQTETLTQQPSTAPRAEICQTLPVRQAVLEPSRAVACQLCRRDFECQTSYDEHLATEKHKTRVKVIDLLEAEENQNENKIVLNSTAESTLTNKNTNTSTIRKKWGIPDLTLTNFT
jgi:hypothetical protein